MNSQDNYIRSNSLVDISFRISGKTRVLTEKILSRQKIDRQKYGQLLLNELSLCQDITTAKLKLSESLQWHKTKNGRLIFKQYGYYRPKSHYIYISNRTAIQGKIISPLTFLNTLIHEWMHHFDFEKLKLHSIHTKGFYLRLSSLKERLGN